jgi:hypothetical protein
LVGEAVQFSTTDGNDSSGHITVHEPPLQPAVSHSQQTDNIVSLLEVIVSQIEGALQETNAPAATLVEATHSMSGATQIIARCLSDFSGSPARVFGDLMLLHDDLHSRAVKAASAVQFHDRLVQSLTHVCSSLSRLAEFMASDSAPKSATEWNELKERIRAAQHQGSGTGKVELF